MEQIAISKFKATCLAVLERVRQTGEPVLVTRFGAPVAEIGPAGKGRLRRREAGRLAHTGRILGDIVSPISNEEDWEALRGAAGGQRGPRARSHRQPFAGVAPHALRAKSAPRPSEHKRGARGRERLSESRAGVRARQ